MLVLYILDSTSVVHRIRHTRLSYTWHLVGSYIVKVSKSIVEKHRLIIGKPVVSDSVVQVRSHTRDLADLQASVLIHC